MGRGGWIRVAVVAVTVLTLPAVAHADGQHAPLRTRAIAGHTTDVTIPGPLVYHGGGFMQSSTVVGVYWRPPGFTAIPDSFKSIVDGYLGNVAADSGTTGNVFSDAVQYGTNYDVSYGGSFIDTDPVPTARDHSGLDDCFDVPSRQRCLSDKQVTDELAAFVDAHGISGDSGIDPFHPTKLLVFFLPPGVVDCFSYQDVPSDPTTIHRLCSGHSAADAYYCAYHGWLDDGSQTWTYANMPYVWDLGGCQEGQSPNDNMPADAAVSVTSHEFIETLTDPYGTAWYDDNGYEIADKCDGQFGTSLGTIAGAGQFNQVIGAGNYWTQLEYSNALSDCYQVGPPAITSFSPQFALAGDTVDVVGRNLFGPLVVKFNGVVANVDTVHSTSTDAKVIVPAGGFGGPITVQALGGSATSSTTFFPSPTITSVSPLDGPVGSQVTITGTNFVDVSSVSLGTIAAAFTPVSSTQLKVTIPESLTNANVTIVTPGGTAVSRDTVGITEVTALSLSSGQVRRTLMLYGRGLGLVNAVRFTGSTSVAPVTVSATRVTVLVPPDAALGPVTVITPRAVVDGPVFRPLPTISRVTPLFALRGASVTITGANLTGATDVRFGGFSAGSFSVDSPTQITATVPSTTAFTGGRVVVTTPPGTASSPQNFTVTGTRR